MNAILPHSFSKGAASFRTSRVPLERLPRASAMPAWRAQQAPDIACVVILIGPPRRTAFRTASPLPLRCLHAYGARGASPLCGATDWHELVPPAEATCPACRGRLDRRSWRAVH